MIPCVEIDSVPPRFQAYYDWLLTGLGLLEQEGILDLDVRQRWWQKPLRFTLSGMSPAAKFMPVFWDRMLPTDHSYVTGRLRMGDRVATFAVDPADSPFIYALAYLEIVDVYFKCQCPPRFEPQGFPLNNQVRIPYHPNVLTFAGKIRPGMLGRPLAGSLSLRRNLRVLRQWEEATGEPKSIRLFASFGMDSGPRVWEANDPFPAPYDHANDPTLLRLLGGQIHHPNRKRAQVVEMLRGMNRPDVSASLFLSANPKLMGPRLTNEQYRRKLQLAAVNLNITGFRRSLPFRFLDTFLCGGMVATDTLAVRWHAPFEPGVDVVEIGDLGYEPIDRVDWGAVRQRLLALCDDRKVGSSESVKAVRDAYKRKWSPRAYAVYFVEECKRALEAQA